MNDRILGILGLMKKASAISIGKEKTEESVKKGKARLLLLPADATERNIYEAERMLTGHSALKIMMPYKADEISEAVGSGGYAMAAVTDIGFAAVLLRALCETGEDYSGELNQIERRVEKAKRRRISKPLNATERKVRED